MEIKNLRNKYKKQLKEHLANKTGCVVQADGWTCGTCFFAMATKKELTNQDWQLLLYFRGDYKKEDCYNLPKEAEWEDRIKNMLDK